MARTIVLMLVLAFVGLLAFLTVTVALQDGVTIVVVVSFFLLVLLGFGALGALTNPPDDR